MPVAMSTAAAISSPLVGIIGASAYIGTFALLSVNVMKDAFERVDSGRTEPGTGKRIMLYKFSGDKAEATRRKISFHVATFFAVVIVYAAVFFWYMVMPLVLERLDELGTTGTIPDYVRALIIGPGDPNATILYSFEISWVSFVYAVIKLINAWVGLTRERR